MEKIIDNGFCIGCGGCQVQKNIPTKENQYGQFLPNTNDFNQLDAQSCPFSDEIKNEIEISKSFYSDDSQVNFHRYIGYYQNIYAGHVTVNNFRRDGTSGGFTKWLLCKLLESGEIDGVIHVVRKNDSNELFEYGISTTIEEIKSASQSAYYTTNFSSVLNKVIRENNDKKYAFVGVPCYCKSIASMKINYPKIKNKIKFIFGIFCGHMKSKNYAKLMAWESGVDPNDLQYVNFRKKTEQDKRAIDYNFHVKTQNQESIKRRDKLSGGDYNIPHLKHKSCDYCEDVFGYCADVVLGDAWLPRYVQDPKGTNIIITRNKFIDQFIIKHANELKMDKLGEKQAMNSQTSSCSHRLKHLPYRLYLDQKQNKFYPTKMAQPNQNTGTDREKLIQSLRIQIRDDSHEAFLQALSKNDIKLYFDKISELINNLNSLYS